MLALLPRHSWSLLQEACAIRAACQRLVEFPLRNHPTRIDDYTRSAVHWGMIKGLIVALIATAIALPLPSFGRSISLAGATAEVCFTPGQDCAQLVSDVITSASRRVWLLGFGFSNRTIINALIASKRRGIDVRLVLDQSNTGERGKGVAMVAATGISVRLDRSVKIAHNKLIIVDDTVVTGSFNWTQTANRRNAENVHIIRGSKALADLNASYFLDRERVSEKYEVR
jgi:phosphatidylserine/phosphatidylglycerophosphate/cardiolipin synthase-like enzyme